MERAAERAREGAAGGLLGRHAVHRSAIALVDQCHRDDLHEVVEMNPRQVLPSGAERPAQSKLERRLHLGQRAPCPTQDDPGAQQSHTHAQRLG